MKKTQQEVSCIPQTDAALSRLKESIRQMPSPGTVAISIAKEDAEWLAAEIDGGREAFQSVVDQKQQAEIRVKALEQTIESMFALRDGLLAEIRELKKKIT